MTPSQNQDASCLHKLKKEVPLILHFLSAAHKRLIRNAGERSHGAEMVRRSGDLPRSSSKSIHRSNMYQETYQKAKSEANHKENAKARANQKQTEHSNKAHTKSRSTTRTIAEANLSVERDKSNKQLHRISWCLGHNSSRDDW